MSTAAIKIPSDDNHDWNQDILENVESSALSNLVVYSRDWTVETIFNQIAQANIDLNPRFQRRNAWNDEARSRLIESLIVGIPVPEVVFAEDPQKKKSFIVIDGKQRLLTLAGFIEPSKFPYWDAPKLQGLKMKPELKGLTYAEIDADPKYADIRRELLNADIRCTVISNYTSDDILYDVFHRLNTSSVPLSTQELRQALIKGEFGAYLMELTETVQPIHSVLGIAGPDSRLRDSELILRNLAFSMFGETYSGNLKKFLDDAMKRLNAEWEVLKPQVDAEYQKFNQAIARLQQVIQARQIGRKVTSGQWEWRFNKAVFEVEIHFFKQLPDSITQGTGSTFELGFTKLCEDQEFRDSIEATTKTVSQYRVRYAKFQALIKDVFGQDLVMPKFLQ